MEELKFRAHLANAVIHFTLADLLNPTPLFSIRHLLIPWLLKGNKPDSFTGVYSFSGVEIYEEDVVRGRSGTEYLIIWDCGRYTCLDFRAWKKGYYDAYVNLDEIGQVGAGNRFTNDNVEVVVDPKLPKALQRK